MADAAPTPRRHREMLVISCLVIAASFVLRVQSGEQVGLCGAAHLVLPPLCLAREWFGVCCPGCGLTRSFIHLAHADWRASWESHRLGWLLAGLVVLQIPYRIHGLCRPQRALLPARVRKGIGYGLIGLLVLNWLIGFLR
jgi:hypothetical protein